MAFSGEIEKLERRWQENPLGLTFAPLAEAYRKAGDPARALELLEQGLAQHPNYVPAHIVRGRCHLDAQSDPAAELAFLRVTELDPENVIALKSLAELSERGGRLLEAFHRLEVLLDVDRNNEEARGQLDHVRELMSMPAPDHSEAEAPIDAPEPSPGRTAEFQLPDDALDLSPSDDRYPEILLQAEVSEELLPVPEAAQGGDSLASADPLEAMSGESVEPPSSWNGSGVEVEAVTELEEPPPTSEVEAVFEYEDTLEPEAEPEPQSEPQPAAQLAPELEPEPAPVAEMEPEPVPAMRAEPDEAPEPVPAMRVEDEEPEPAGVAAEPELMVTETMAEIFLRQGHRELALAVYSQLVQREPDNERVAGAAARLRAELAPTASAPVPGAADAGAEPRQRFDAATTGGRSVGDLFGGLLRAERPSVAPAIHPPAFEAPRRPSGEPTRPAPESLSLSAVFGEDAVPAGPAGGPPEPGSAEPSFEQFFTPAEGSTAEVQLPKPPDDQAVMSSLAPEDLEQFNAWLRGLKR